MSAEPVVAPAEATATPTESTPAAVAPTPVEEKPSSSKLLDFARKEADFARKEVARKEELQKLQEQLQSYEEDVKYFRSAKETYKSNPEALLNKLGITYDELTEAVLDYYENKDKAPPTLDAAAIRKEIEAEFRKQEETKRAGEAQAAVNEFVNSISTFVQEKAETFPHLSKLHKPLGESDTPEELLFSIVENYYNETGELLDLETAATTAEEYLRDEWGKLNGVLSGKPTPSAPVENKTENKVVPQTTTTGDAAVAPVSVSAFRIKDRESPSTITNNFAKGTTKIPYKDNANDRRDAISKAVAAMEEAARRPR